MAHAYIVSAVRTPGGKRNGKLSGWHPVDLAAQVLNALPQRAQLDPALVEDVIMGCVSQFGEQSANVARMAVLASNLPEHVPGVALDRQCGSSQQALHFAAQAVMSGTQDIVIACGVESMSRVPMMSPTTVAEKAGMGFYQTEAINKKYNNVRFSQFMGAEMVARKYDLSKDVLDAYALQSHQRAAAATKAGLFTSEILPLAAKMNDGTPLNEMLTADEGIRADATIEAIQSVKLLQEGGRITAANASQICDGASGVLVVSEAALRAHKLTPLARIHHMSVTASDPVIMLETPIPATEKALKKIGMALDEIDLFEVNEAFASIPLAWAKALGADAGKLNVNGGAIALGHPLGASGTKLMTTLIHALHQRKGRYGLQTMCEGGGMANVTLVERM